MGNKISIIMIIFEKLEYFKNREVIFLLEAKWPLVVQVFDQLQNAVKMTGYQSFKSSISFNIWRILANFLCI